MHICRQVKISPTIFAYIFHVTKKIFSWSFPSDLRNWKMMWRVSRAIRRHSKSPKCQDPNRIWFKNVFSRLLVAFAMQFRLQSRFAYHLPGAFGPYLNFGFAFFFVFTLVLICGNLSDQKPTGPAAASMCVCLFMAYYYYFVFSLISAARLLHIWWPFDNQTVQL